MSCIEMAKYALKNIHNSSAANLINAITVKLHFQHTVDKLCR